MAKNFVFPQFSASGTETPREVIEKDTTERYKISINGLEMTKGESGGVSMMRETGMEVAQYYRPHIPNLTQKNGLFCNRNSQTFYTKIFLKYNGCDAS